MTPGPSTLVQCPGCPTIFVREVPAPSGSDPENLWSDGYAEYADGWEVGPGPLFSCPRCNRWYRLDDVRRLVAIPAQLRPLTIPTIPDETALTVEQFEAALRQEWEPLHERMLRLRLLWLQNHPRRREGADQGVWRELMDNLECLCELVDPEDEPILAAEVRRELGEFPAALEILDRISESSLAPAERGMYRRLREETGARSILPFRLPHPVDSANRPTGEPASRADPVYQWLERGVDLFPAPEDVFAFPTMAKEQEEDPILAIRLDSIEVDWSGWAPILRDGDDELLFRFGRVFRKGEWELYEGATPLWKRTLEWFWRQWSVYVEQDGSSEPANLYYRILHQIVYGVFDPGSDGGLAPEIGTYRAQFDAFYRGFQPANDYYDRFWDVYWAFTSEGRSFQSELQDLDLDQIRGARERRKKERARRRESAVSGLDYLEIGGEPRWYYGVDRTPTVSGRRCRFVGQIWLDYVNAGSSLVHLFYDSESGTLVQVTEQD